MGPEATPYKLMEKSKKDKHGNWVHPRAAEIDLGYQRLMSQPMPQGQEPDDFESYYTASGGYNDKNCVWGIGSAAPELFEPPANRTTRHSVSSYSPTMYSQVATENKLLKNRLSRMDMELIYQRRKGDSMEAFLSQKFGWTPPPDPRCSRGPLPGPRDDDFTDDGHPFGSQPVC